MFIQSIIKSIARPLRRSNPRMRVPWLPPDLKSLNQKTRIVEDVGRKWFEFGWVSSDLFGGSQTEGWSDASGNYLFFIQYSEDLRSWTNNGFLPAPVPVVGRPDGSVEYWSRAVNPVNAVEKTQSLLCYSDALNGDARNNPFTGVTIGSVALPLPNFPYTMPDDAAQLQVDIRAAGYPDALVTASSDTVWSIAITDVDVIGYQATSFVSWPTYTTPDPILGGNIYINNRHFQANSIDSEGNRIVEKAFARLGVSPGFRYGVPAPPYPKNPVFVNLPPLLPPAESGGPTTPLPVNYPPYLAGAQSLLITGSNAAGATLTRPALVWTNPHGSEMTVVGTWWKNGEATDEHGATYNDTADGDLIEYREIATNGIGASTPPTWPKFAVSDAVAAYQADMHDEMSPLISGKAGAADMVVFSALNHVTPTYTRNASLWAASLVSQLTGCAAWKNRAVESYGGVLITPRHVLYCNHAHPHAEGTWIYPSPQQIVRFVKADGTAVSAVQICQTDYNSAKPGYINPAAYSPANLDLCVALLDRDLTLDGINVFPIPLVRSVEEYIAMNPTGAPKMAASQGSGRSTSTVPPTPISDYPQYNKSMIYVRTVGGFQADAPYGDLDYAVWDGDSGTPAFLLHRGVMYLEGIIVTSGWGRVPVPLHVARINQMIAAADAGAVALGRLVAPTGLTVTATELPSD